MAQGKYYGLELFDIDRYISDRQNCITNKGGALNTQIDELCGIINLSAFARRFFGKSQSWFSQRLHGSLVMHKEQSFKSNEYAQIADGFRELARQLNQYADELREAK